MDNEPTTCRLRVSWRRDDDAPGEYAIQSLHDIKGSSDLTAKLQLQWVEGIVNLFSTNPEAEKVTTIRPWDILLHRDCSVEALSSEEGKKTKKKNGNFFYPFPFRFPPQILLALDEEEEERVKRIERFALGSLIYEVMTTTEPFEELSAGKEEKEEDEVQNRFSRGIFPDDVFSMAMGPFILGCWSLEFEEEMKKLLAHRTSFGTRFCNYARAHPFLLAAQITSGVVATAPVAVPLALGFAGFSATGPVALSAAAVWQSSIGAVQAGSLFSWCQSAAMGGAAVNGIFAAGVAGGAAVAGATTAGVMMPGGDEPMTPKEMEKRFRAVYRTGKEIGGVDSTRKGWNCDGMGDDQRIMKMTIPDR